MRKYHSVKFDVIERLVKLPTGATFTASIIIHKPVVVIIPILKGKILLEKQYRHSIDKWLYELPAGFLQNKISLKRLAAKELHEETGYTAQRLNYLFKAYAAIGTSNEMYYYFIATGLQKKRQELEKYEMIELKLVSIKKALSMIKKNEIVDGKTIQGILYYKFLSNTQARVPRPLGRG